MRFVRNYLQNQLFDFDIMYEIKVSETRMETVGDCEEGNRKTQFCPVLSVSFMCPL